MLDAEARLEPSLDADADAEAETGLERALALAYRYLNSRERTQAEMGAHLERKGIDARDVERSIRVLVEQGYLDDARFAHLFVQDKRELEGWGADRIRQVLRTRGIDAEVVDEALAEHEQDSEGDVERALAVLRRRFPSPPRERRERDRALGVLLRKGYDAEHALEAIAAHARAADV